MTTIPPNQNTGIRIPARTPLEKPESTWTEAAIIKDIHVRHAERFDGGAFCAIVKMPDSVGRYRPLMANLVKTGNAPSELGGGFWCPSNRSGNS